jgi:putative peptide maturation system protein
MPDLNSSPAAKLAGTTMSLRDGLVRLKQRRQLQPLLREVVLEEYLVQQAATVGLAISTEQLQSAADAFRRRHGLHSAEQTSAWLARDGLSILDLEAVLERDLLVARLREHVTAGLVQSHFTAHRTDYDRVRLGQIVVARADLARELVTQIREEGRDFTELAREHSLHAPSREHGGELGVVLRRQLPPGAEAVFAAREGDVIGPVALPDGFHLFRVGEMLAAELDGRTAELIRRELFDNWLAERLGGARPELPLLEGL